MCVNVSEKVIFNGKYIVTSSGDIYSIKNGARKKLHKTFTLEGNQVVSLNNGVNSRQYSVGRLVAENFIPNPNNYHYINYLDDDQTNNDYTNLVWSQKNMPRNKRKTQLKEEKMLLNEYVNNHPYETMSIHQSTIVKMRIEGKTYAEISDKLNISRQAANQVIKKIIGNKAEEKTKVKLLKNQIDNIQAKIDAKSQRRSVLQNNLDKTSTSLNKLMQELAVLESKLKSYYSHYVNQTNENEEDLT